MRLGYSWWGFLGDRKEDANGNALSTPDGNATYSWSIIYEAQRRGWSVYAMQENRDYQAWLRYGSELFSSFSKEKRTSAYTNLINTNGIVLPDLDVLLLEWRFEIPGRNVPDSNGKIVDYQPDFKRQSQLLGHYLGTKTKIIIWDLDHKFDLADEIKINPDAVFETSVEPCNFFIKRTRVEPPILVDDLLQYETLPSNASRKLVYIGSRYERDDVITQYIKPTSEQWPGHVEFWGNWLKTVDECIKLWPCVSYYDRITVCDFRRVYGEAVACPLLAKRSYLKTGFITPRPWEALMFGTIPIGLEEAKGINDYVIFSAYSGQNMAAIAEYLSKLSLRERDKFRKQNIEKIEFMDARHFVNKIEDVLSAGKYMVQNNNDNKQNIKEITVTD